MSYIKQSSLVKRVPYDENREILLSNLTGDIILAGKEVSALFDRFKEPQSPVNFAQKERETIEKLKKMGFLVDTNDDEMESLKNNRKCDIVTFCGGKCIANALTRGKKDLEPECPPYYYNFDEYIRGIRKVL